MPMGQGDSISCVATKDIQPGEEITFTYYGQAECIRSHARHKLLHFVCTCKACLPGTPFHKASEMRRQLLRGLYYLTMGLDMGQENPRAPSRIIVDPKLREAAKTLSIPLTSRFFYDTSIGLLLEEEELAEHQMIQQINSTMGYVRARLGSGRNVKTVACALRQDTWLKKWQVASTIFGLPDPGDQYASSELQHMRSNGMY